MKGREYLSRSSVKGNIGMKVSGSICLLFEKHLGYDLEEANMKPNT